MGFVFFGTLWRRRCLSSFGRCGGIGWRWAEVFRVWSYGERLVGREDTYGFVFGFWR